MNSPTILPVYTPGMQSHTPPETHPRRGALLMAVSSYLFSFVHAGTKVLSQDNVTVSQLILSRCVVICLVIWLQTLFYKLPHGIFGPPEVRKLLIARAVLGYLGLVASMNSIIILRLGDAITISFTIPILMVVLAAVFLGESIKPTDILAILLGIAGVACIAQPEMIFGHPEIGTLYSTSLMGYVYAGLSTILNGFGNVLIRKIGSRVHTLHIVFYFMLIPIVPSFMWCCFKEYELLSWPSSVYNWSWLSMFIFSSCVGQVLFSESLQIAPVSAVTPLIFLQVVFAFINDWVLFQLSPPAWSLLGALFVATSVIITTR